MTMLHSTSRLTNETSVLPIDELMICMDRFRVKSAGIFHGDNPLHFPTTMLLAQLALPSLMTACLQFVLAPLGETDFFCQMMVIIFFTIF